MSPAASWVTVALVSCLALTEPVAAQSRNLSRADSPGARIGHAMTTAGRAGGVYLFGGAVPGGRPRLVDSLWRWNGATWRVAASNGPLARGMPAAAFDTRRGVMVLYGGAGLGSGTLFGDTWEFNGQHWRERNVRTPGPRDHHAMAYDEARGVTVMFGGRPLDNTGPFPKDTWTWDGTSWTRVDSTTGPDGVGHHAMAYDSHRQRVVLYGGSGDDGAISDVVWEWDGKRWNRIVATPGPDRRARHRMAYDPVRRVTVLYGGGIGQGPTAGPPPSDTWGWDGQRWTRLATEGPPVRYVHAMAWDAKRQRIVMYGGGSSHPPYNLLDDLWEWDGRTWHEITPATAPSPPPRAHASMTYDAARGEVVLAGGSTEGRNLGDAWGWNGVRWRRLRIPELKRTSHSLIYDPVRRKVLMVGGADLAAPPATSDFGNGLFELGPAGWNPLGVDSLPARLNAAVGYDAKRHRMVVFGGMLGDSALGDTQEFDGTRWRRVSVIGPSARSGGVMAYHAATQRLVLFGGRSASADLHDTWSWDGTRWTLVDTTGPVGRAGGVLVHDEARRELLLVGGVSANFTKREAAVWAWTGARWEPRDSVGPSPRSLLAMAYDARRQVVVLFGGRGAGRVDRNDIWEWDGHRWREVR